MFYHKILQFLLPGHILSRIAAKVANCRIPQVKNFLIREYCKFYNIDLSEAAEEDYTKYATFNDFFTRALKPSTRHIDDNPQSIISPVDGWVWQIGTVDDHDKIQVKGEGFSLAQLLVNSTDTQTLSGAKFAVLYLAPNNYHRVHMPLAGKLIKMRYVPGKLFSVSPQVASYMPDVFAQNERVIAMFDTALGKMAVIFVGAMIVGSIETAWAGVIDSGWRKGIKEWDYQKQNLFFECGAEIGKFRLGSTVIVLLPAGSCSWHQNLQPSAPILMGQSLGHKL